MLHKSKSLKAAAMDVREEGASSMKTWRRLNTNDFLLTTKTISGSDYIINARKDAMASIASHKIVYLNSLYMKYQNTQESILMFSIFPSKRVCILDTSMADIEE